MTDKFVEGYKWGLENGNDNYYSGWKLHHTMDKSDIRTYNNIHKYTTQ